MIERELRSFERMFVAMDLRSPTIDHGEKREKHGSPVGRGCLVLLCMGVCIYIIFIVYRYLYIYISIYIYIHTYIYIYMGILNHVCIDI